MQRVSLIRPRLLILPLLLVAAAGGCRQEPDGVDLNAAQNAVNKPPIVPRPAPPLDRVGLLAAVAKAASAAAAGTAPPADLKDLDGRQFQVRIRFGCRGPSTEVSSKNWLSWTYDSESRTIRVQARPTISEADPLVANIGGEGFEAAEGFWIPRPWLQQAVCPATAAVKPAGEQEVPQSGGPSSADPAAAEEESPDEQEPLPARQRVGIAQFFTETDPRTGRRDHRPYQARHTLREGQAIGSQGFNLVLSGRLRAIPGRSVIECTGADADTPPDCIVSAEFQRVWIEQPETGEVIAEWGGG